MQVSDFYVFCSFFVVLSSFRVHLLHYFMIIKLTIFLRVNRNKMKPLLLFFISITSFFIKYIAVGLSFKGFDFFSIPNFKNKLLIYLLIFVIQLFKLPNIIWFQKLLDNDFLKIIILSGLNSFDVSTANDLTLFYLKDDNLNYILYVVNSFVFGFANFLNRYLTVISPSEWNFDSFLKEGIPYLITYSIIVAGNLVCFGWEFLNYLLNFGVIFFLSCYNWKKMEKKKLALKNLKEEKN